MDRPQLLERLTKLLNRTTANGATEAEAETAMARAQAMMDEHNIAMADVNGADPMTTLFGEHVARTDKSLASHFVVVIGLVEQVFAVKGIVRQSMVKGPSGRGRVESVAIGFFGDPVNVTSAAWALNFLGPCFRSFWDRYRTRTGAPSSAMLGYYCGLRDGYLEKIKARRQLAELALPGSSRALAVVADRLQSAFSDAFPDVRHVVKSGNQSAYGDGVKDGADVNLGRPIEQSARKALEPSRTRALAQS